MDWVGVVRLRHVKCKKGKVYEQLQYVILYLRTNLQQTRSLHLTANKTK